ncbi:probable 18S rRNA (guanine-N(7))-methyltransferase isoform X2 [Carcharodon carcharias]|uniref:probable 18S rRNA (guanine-N(7))-methyltransferase isoform X2 n=1 Tax=Carcharodon carcharias TaxID=13397 RepID=UPI001B7F3387|nr:probable 18S rRNA (guanine-N(7))-methyltransferase isoform X2 [Carcharodon carcharias]
MAARVGRPEHRAPPEVFYNEDEARKYTQKCGSGLSGDYLSEEGHHWVGVDISAAMLDVALEREVEGDLILGDVGAGIPFRAGTFDGCISISALQWLCNADKKSHSPPKRLYKFFSSLYASLVRGARAVFQLYPENSEQLELITAQAMKAGFTGGMVVDYPNSSKAKKFFLCLFVGVSGKLPMGLGAQVEETMSQVQFTNARLRFKNLKGKPAKRSRDWILEKKERRRRQGRTVRNDTKYTGRKRKTRF